MTNSTSTPPEENVLPIPFKAETKKLLDILIHSLYKDREIFLRELISNASDALTRFDFEILTNREVRDADLPLEIRIKINPDEQSLSIIDTGIGMTADELVENLGTVAHSGVQDFVLAAQSGAKDLVDVIGQFGVGFYSAFMVADWINVTSLSSRQNTDAAQWFCTGSDTYTIQPAEKDQRGTVVTVKLKEDALEFLEEHKIKEIIRKHSDFVPFPIYFGDEQEQVNRQTAIWRQPPRQVEKASYNEFYRQITLDFDDPITHLHLDIDAPVQLYAILYFPAKPDRGLFTLRREDGIKLYSRKVLIQEYCKDLLPEYFRFIQGVVDTEDLPLNVSRETIQSNRVITQIKKILTAKVIDTLLKLSKEEPEKYLQFWEHFGVYVKEGIAVDQSEPEALYPLLRFHTNSNPDEWSSLDEYIGRMPAEQNEIYYLHGDDIKSILLNPHLDAIRAHSYEALLMTDPIDAFMMVKLNKYQEKNLVNAAQANLKIPERKESEVESQAGLPVEQWTGLIDRFKTILKDSISDVRITDRLTDSPARLVDAEGAPNQQVQRVYRLLKEDFPIPKQILELNPHHPIIVSLNSLPNDSELSAIVIEQIYEDALLIEGLHQNPASMITRIQKLIEAALGG